MALTAICAKINAPIFSIKHPEAFQIAATLPMPQPSTLVGALAYCLGIHEGIGLKAYEEVREAVIAARAKLIGEAAVVTPVILRRFRILDKGFERKGKGEVAAFERACKALQQGDLDAFRRSIETELTDALYREYLSFAALKCVWILKRSFDSKLLYLLQRLGDTESLVTVAEAWPADCESSRSETIITEYPFAAAPNLVDQIKGNYTTLRMCDEKREPRIFYIPCKKEIRSTPEGSKYFTYMPTKVDVKLKIPQEFFIVDGECIAR